ncbi:MAG: hypothetical protein WA952_02075 [Lewinella sp.]
MLSNSDFHAFADEVQEQCLTRLKNEEDLLLLEDESLKLYGESMDSSVVSEYATVVATPQEADLANLRVNTP